MNNVKQEAVTMALENLAWCTERLRRTGQFGWCLLSDWTSHGWFQHKNEFVCHGSAAFWEWDNINWTMSTLSSSMVILMRTTSYLVMCKLKTSTLSFVMAVLMRTTSLERWHKHQHHHQHQRQHQHQHHHKWANEEKCDCKILWNQLRPGWQKLCGGTGGPRQKVWTRTKILSLNISYFDAN